MVARSPSSSMTGGPAQVEAAGGTGEQLPDAVAPDALVAVDLVHGVVGEQLEPAVHVVEVEQQAVLRQQVADLGVVVGDVRHGAHARGSPSSWRPMRPRMISDAPPEMVSARLHRKLWCQRSATSRPASSIDDRRRDQLEGELAERHVHLGVGELGHRAVARVLLVAEDAVDGVAGDELDLLDLGQGEGELLLDVLVLDGQRAVGKAGGADASATRSSKSRSSCTELAPTKARSEARPDVTSFQPPLTSPSTCSGPRRTSSRKTSQNSASPVISRMGRTSMPGRSIGTTKAVTPAWRSLGVGAGQQHTHVGPLGVGAPDLLAGDEEAVAVGHGLRAQRDEVAAGVGLAEELAPDVLAAADLRQVLLLLLLGAELDDGVGRQHDLVEGAVGPSEDQLLHEDQVVHRQVVGTATPLDRPAAPEVLRLVEGTQPVTEAAFLVSVDGDPHALPAHRDTALGDEGLDLGPVGVDVDGHQDHPSISTSDRTAAREPPPRRASW